MKRKWNNPFIALPNDAEKEYVRLGVSEWFPILCSYDAGNLIFIDIATNKKFYYTEVLRWSLYP